MNYKSFFLICLMYTVPAHCMRHTPRLLARMSNEQFHSLVRTARTAENPAYFAEQLKQTPKDISDLEKLEAHLAQPKITSGIGSRFFGKLERLSQKLAINTCQYGLSTGVGCGSVGVFLFILEMRGIILPFTSMDALQLGGTISGAAVLGPLTATMLVTAPAALLREHCELNDSFNQSYTKSKESLAFLRYMIKSAKTSPKFAHEFYGIEEEIKKD